MSASTILITGVRGKTGREVAKQLAGHRDLTLRGGSANPERVDTMGVVPVAFDWERPETWAAAVEGVDAVYLMRPEVEDAPERVARLLRATPAAARIVLLSEMGAEDGGGGPWVSEVERAVVDGVESWTILRPGWFQQVLTDERFFRGEIADRSVISLPTRGAGISWVDARDIAAVAVEALINPGHEQASYTISGPAALRLDDVAEMLSAATGREIRALDPPAAESLAGLEPWLVTVVGEMYERLASGTFAEVSDAVIRVTGRRPRSLAAFIDEHASAWSGR